MPKQISPGDKFGRLTATREANEAGPYRWECACECGSTKVASKYDLLKGDVKSCGCYRRELGRQRMTRHGATKGSRRSPGHSSWAHMVERCTSPSSKAFPAYGGAGIKVCKRWLIFENFLADMGPRPPGTSIDRIDNSLGYEPGNCRWADRKTQSRNRTIARLMTLDGQTKTMAEWVEATGLSQGLLNARVNRLGWSDERALTTPVDASKRKKSLKLHR